MTEKIDLDALARGLTGYIAADPGGPCTPGSPRGRYRTARTALLRAHAAGRAEGAEDMRERAARLIEDNSIVDSSDGQRIRPRRGDGDKFGRAYADAIRALPAPAAPETETPDV